MGFRQYLPLSLGKPIFFVSPDGSDSDGDGTFERPWRTISKGVANLSGWDTLYIRGGTYVEQVTIHRSGTPESPIRIAAYPGEEVIIDGEAGVNGLNEGLPNIGELFGTESRDGTGFRYTPLVSIEANYIIFEDIKITRSMGRGLRIWRNGRNTRGVTVRNCAISFSRKNGLLVEQRCSEITIENCDISRSGNFAPYDRPSGELDWGGALVVKGSHNIIVKGTSVHENWGEGYISDSQTNRSSNLLIKGCVFYDNMRPSIYLHAVSDVVVEGNILYHSNNAEFPDIAGIAITPSEPQYDEVVDTEDVTVVNNIIVGFGSNLGLWGPEGRYLRRVRIFFNTLINGQEIGIMESGQYQSCEIKNNLVYQANGKPLVNRGGDFSGCTVSHNAWSQLPPDNVRSASDVIGDPMLRNPEALRIRGQVNPDWYKIKPDSPVIGQAYVVEPVIRDFFGAERDAQPDIGAHEYQGQPTADDSLTSSTDAESSPLFFGDMLSDKLSAIGFKRFVIVSTKSSNQPDGILAFGIQFPDQQVLVYGVEAENAPGIFENVDQVLEDYKNGGTQLHWVDS
jgi:hypothetical protein